MVNLTKSGGRAGVHGGDLVVLARRQDALVPLGQLEACRLDTRLSKPHRHDSLLGDEEAEVCIVRELERLSWPRPQTKVAQVTWPFLFLD